MAKPIACDLCNTETALMLQTDIETGQVLAVGAACMFPFHLGAARGIAETMDADIKTAYVVEVLALHQLFGDEIGANAVPGPEAEPVPPFKLTSEEETQADAALDAAGIAHPRRTRKHAEPTP